MPVWAIVLVTIGSTVFVCLGIVGYLWFRFVLKVMRDVFLKIDV